MQIPEGWQKYHSISGQHFYRSWHCQGHRFGLLKEKDTPTKNFLSFNSDGACVMMGSRSGVGARIKNGYDQTDAEGNDAEGNVIHIEPVSPFLIHIHCVAHR